MIKGNSLKMALATLWALVVLVLLIFGLKLLKEFVLAPEGATSLRLFSTPPKHEERTITIYFANEYASMLVPEERSARLGAGTAADAAAIMSELVKGPQAAGLLPTIPADTRLLNAYEIGHILVLDFTHELQTNHTGGSTGELLTIYSIVNTMAKNLEGARKVLILVDGEEKETLAGHVDLTKPLSPNMKWTTAPPRQITGSFECQTDRENTGRTPCPPNPRLGIAAGRSLMESDRPT